MDKIGESAMEFRDAVDSGDSMDRLYDLQHADPKVSKLVSSFSYYDYYFLFLDWIQKKLTKPSSFVNLGCGNGLFTLALSKLWESAQGVGIDSNGSAIHMATRYSALAHSSEKIDFYCADLAEPLISPTLETVKYAEYIFSGFLLHELIEDEDGLSTFVQNVGRMSGPETKFISLERFPDTEGQREYLIQKMGLVGLKPLVKEVLCCKEERFPLTVFSRWSLQPPDNSAIH